MILAQKPLIFFICISPIFVWHFCEKSRGKANAHQKLSSFNKTEWFPFPYTIPIFSHFSGLSAYLWVKIVENAQMLGECFFFMESINVEETFKAISSFILFISPFWAKMTALYLKISIPSWVIVIWRMAYVIFCKGFDFSCPGKIVVRDQGEKSRGENISCKYEDGRG